MQLFKSASALFLIGSLLGGCAIAPNAEVTNVNSKQYGNASLRYSDVRIHQIDGKPFNQPSVTQLTFGKSDIYIKPGKHQVDISLNYVSHGYTTTIIRDPTIRSICFNAEAGKTYSIEAYLFNKHGLAGLFKTPDSEIKVVEFKSIHDKKPVGYNCH